MADMEFDNVTQESRGNFYPGRLRLRQAEVLFKNEKTGKVDHFPATEVAEAQWLLRSRGYCLRLLLKNGTIHRYDGFGESDFDRIAQFVKRNYECELSKRELSYKGWNYGNVEFVGNAMEFSINNAMVFEVPLNNVANVAVAKNEVTFEFHQGEESDIMLTEMRFHTPGADAEEGPAAEFAKKALKKADTIQAVGESVVELKELQCLQPRGRYDLKLYDNFIHLHGKTFDYKVPKSTIIRLLLLPHPDNRTYFFVIQLEPPIKHGQTRYYFIIVLFERENQMEVELKLDEATLEANYGGKLTKTMAGAEYEVVAKLLKALYNVKVTVPGNYQNKSGDCCISCGYRASNGLLYPLERLFIFVPKPAVSFRMEDIVGVQFSRGTGAQRSFDLEVETRNNVTHTFTSIEKDEYHRLFDFVAAKKLRVLNITDDNRHSTGGLEDVWSSDESPHDAYMEKVKTEGRHRTAEVSGPSGGGDDSDDEDDEDFRPPEGSASEVSEEYDSNPQSSSSRSSSSGGGKGKDEGSAKSEPSNSEKEEKKKRVKKEKKVRKERSSKKRQKKDVNAPKRPATGYIIWFNGNREMIKQKIGSNAITEVAKAGGEMWKQLTPAEKEQYQKQAEEARKRYDEEMREYKKTQAAAAAAPASSERSEKKTKEKKKSEKNSSAAATKAGTGAAYKSAEYIESSSSSSTSSVLDSESEEEEGDGVKKEEVSDGGSGSD